jgi:hypothetical protein
MVNLENESRVYFEKKGVGWRLRTPNQRIANLMYGWTNPNLERSKKQFMEGQTTRASPRT